MSGRGALGLLLAYASSESEGEIEPTKVAAIEPRTRPATKQISKQIERREKKCFDRKAMLNDCGCKGACSSKIGRDRRLEINAWYWRLSGMQQHSFVLQFSKRSPVKRRRGQVNCISQNFRRQFSYEYQLENERGVPQNVCCAFFLNTLGYDAKSRFVMSLQHSIYPIKIFYNTGHFSNMIYRYHDQAHNDDDDAPIEKRGRYTRPKNLQDSVKQDICLYSPTNSHYRREHAPHALYLPSDLSAQKMFDSFNERQLHKGEQTCCYGFYCKMLRELNIRFTQLGHEECERCHAQHIHESQTGHSIKADNSEQEKESPAEQSTCELCLNWKEHISKAISGREEYDSDRLNVTLNKSAFSVDLQKVVQLPRMESFKEVIFCKRIIAFNETFAPLGGSRNGPVRAFLWNDVIAGRKAYHIASVFYNFFSSLDSEFFVTLWLDNCSAQNKNWDLMILLALLVNSPAVKVHQINLKFLEPGHTYMSADSFHASVERTMKNGPRGEVHSFPDFVDCVKNSGGDIKPQVIVMEPSDFFECSFQFKQSVLNKLKDRPKMANIKHVIFNRGSFDIQYSYNYNDGMKTLKVLTKKQLKEVTKPSFNLNYHFERQSEARGIQKSRKDAIIKKLLPLMSAEKHDYWIHLPENEVCDND